MQLRHLAVALCALAGLASCSLLEKLAEQEFILRSDFAIDSRAPQFPTWQLPTAACGTAAECCGAADAEACAMRDEYLRCDGSVCSAVIPVRAHQTVDIKVQVGAFRSTRRLADVRIQSLLIDVGENTLTVSVPEVSLAVAPSDVTDPGSPSATLLGTVPTIMGKETGEFEVELTDDGKEILGDFVENVGAPFNLIVSTTVELAAGQQAMGKLTGQVALRVKAKPEL